MVECACCQRLGDISSTAPAGAPCASHQTQEICSGSEAGSYLRLIDFVYHSTLGLRVINKNKKKGPEECRCICCPVSPNNVDSTNGRLLALSHARCITLCTPRSGDTTPCKVTPVILHGVVSPNSSQHARGCIPRPGTRGKFRYTSGFNYVPGFSDPEKSLDVERTRRCISPRSAHKFIFVYVVYLVIYDSG